MRILGLHFDRPYIRWALLEFRGKKGSLQSLKSLIPGTPDDVKQLYSNERKDQVATGIKTLVRPLDFKISSKKKILEGLPFQIESLTQLGLEELVYSSQIFLKKAKEAGAEATIFFTSKDLLKAHIEDWKAYAVDPDLVTSISQALLRFVEFRCPELKTGFIVNLGSEEVSCVWFAEGKVKKSFIIEGGITSLLSALWEDRKKVLFQHEVEGVAKQIDLMQLKPNLNPLLSNGLHTLRNKLSTVLYSFQDVAGSLPILFTGRTDAFSQFRPYLLETSPESVLYEPPLPLNVEEQKTAVAIGFALEAAVKEPSKVQFLNGDFIPTKQWKKAGLVGLSLLLISAVLSATFLSVGLRQLQDRKLAFANSLSGMVSQIDPDLQRSLFQDGIEEGMFLATKAIQKHDKEAPFLLQTPTVSEVLTWLTTHPLLDSLSKTGDPLELIDLKYQLVSFPRIGHMRDPYSAKVELQFRLKQSMSARRFHEELLKGDHLVDGNQEISWDSANDSYQTSFYLKNRLPHVR